MELKLKIFRFKKIDARIESRLKVCTAFTANSSGKVETTLRDIHDILRFV